MPTVFCILFTAIAQRDFEVCDLSVSRLSQWRNPNHSVYGGGGTSSDLPWGRNPDEDDRRFAYRCMMQAHKMLKPSHLRLGIGGRR